MHLTSLSDKYFDMLRVLILAVVARKERRPLPCVEIKKEVNRGDQSSCKSVTLEAAMTKSD